jgi:hypothetical protein
LSIVTISNENPRIAFGQAGGSDHFRPARQPQSGIKNCIRMPHEIDQMPAAWTIPLPASS